MEEKSHTAEDVHKILQMSEISLWLDDYDDLFSDFDPRSYSERSLSQDFLAEIKRASRDKTTGEIELKFLIPKDKKNSADEHLIKKRLKEHFKKHLNLSKKDIKDVINRGAFFIVIGIIVMMLAAFVLYKNHDSIFTSFLIILAEPSGWFFFWEGLRQILFDANQKRPEVDFYQKMHRCDIHFMPY